MSIEAMTRALAADVGDATRKLVLIGYSNHAHKDGRNAWASKDTIAEYANCSKRTVQRHVEVLIESGWLRRGDQEQVAHLRADRRPVVYDVAMNESARAAWAAGRGDTVSPRHAGDEEPRGDRNVSPRSTPTGGQPVTPSTVHGVTQPCPPRGDTAVSPEPYLNQGTTPQPPASGGPACTKPGPTPHPNCRGCGTTNRQLADEAKRVADAARRHADQAQARAERERLAASRRPVEDLPDHLADAIARTRRTLAASRRPA